jgi:hypothetical protein
MYTKMTWTIYVRTLPSQFHNAFPFWKEMDYVKCVFTLQANAREFVWVLANSDVLS